MIDRYFVGTASHDLLRYLTRDSSWIAKICEGLIEERAQGGDTTGHAPSQFQLEHEIELAEKMANGIRIASSASSVHGLLRVCFCFVHVHIIAKKISN